MIRSALYKMQILKCAPYLCRFMHVQRSTSTGSLWFVVALAVSDSTASKIMRLVQLRTVDRSCTVRVLISPFVIFYIYYICLFSFRQVTCPINASITKLEPIKFGHPSNKTQSSHFCQLLYYNFITFLLLINFIKQLIWIIVLIL